MKFNLCKVVILFAVFNLKVSYAYCLSNYIKSGMTSFKDVHLNAGIRSTGIMGHSASWVDINNDGCIDLIATNTSIRRPPRTFLFLNQCDGKFVDINKNSGISDFNLIRSSAAADYDNDGYVDIVLGGIDVYGVPTLYQNIGEGKFLDVTEIANITGQGYSSNLTWVDYNLDGYVDLFDSGNSKYLYKNNGNGSFVDVIHESNIITDSKNLSSLWFDYNNDNLPDLFLSNDNFNNLFRNNGDGTFTDVTDHAGIKGEKSWKSVGACTGDFNNDGFIDMYIVNLSSDRKALYKNNGNGTFTDITVESGTADVGDGRTCSFVDYDSDGFIDIFTTNHIRASKLYRNNRDGTFTDTAYLLGVDRPIDAFSATWGDFNGDAVMDVFLNGHIGIALYKGFNLNNSVVVELVGDGINTNTSAIGSRVEVKTKSKTQIREILGGKGCCENDMLPAHFGLGQESVFELNVKWTSGKICKFDNLNAETERIYKVWEEGCEIFSY